MSTVENKDLIKRDSSFLQKTGNQIAITNKVLTSINENQLKSEAFLEDDIMKEHIDELFENIVDLITFFENEGDDLNAEKKALDSIKESPLYKTLKKLGHLDDKTFAANFKELYFIESLKRLKKA